MSKENGVAVSDRLEVLGKDPWDVDVYVAPDGHVLWRCILDALVRLSDKSEPIRLIQWGCATEERCAGTIARIAAPRATLRLFVHRVSFAVPHVQICQGDGPAVGCSL